jgi:ABC-type multidrug transport system fused ATPase/permease subunit
VLTDRSLFGGFVVAAGLHATGHAATSVAAGLLGGALSFGRSLDISTFKVVWTPQTLAMVGLLATTAKGVGATVGATLQSRVAQKVVSAVRRDVAEALLLAGTDLPPGVLSARIAVRLGEIEVSVRDGLLTGLRSALTLIPLAIALVFLSSKLTLLALLLVIPFALGTAFARKKWRRVHAEALSFREGLHRQLDELATQMDVWRTYGAERGVCDALDALGARSAAAAGRADGVRALVSGLNESVAALALLFAVMMAHSISPAGEARLITFCAVVFMSYRPIRDLSEARGALERGALALAAVEQTVASPRPRVEALSPPPPTAPRAWRREPLLVRNLEVPRSAGADRRVEPDPFDGPEHRLQSMSFSAEPGEIVAVVGATGAGKTTLLRALLGLEPSASGSVLYGPDELTKRGVGPTERPFAWVPQDAPILAGTLDDNVLVNAGLPGAPDVERRGLVSYLLRHIGAERLTLECAGQELGAVGRPVSGGERKWICLARALATALPVLLLDEPTAGLDPESERRLLQALDRLRTERTIVLVTHHAEPLKVADRVVRLGVPFQNWERNRTSFSNKSRMSGMS